MGYHLGITSIQRVKQYLDVLLKTQDNTIVFKIRVGQSARTVAHLLRQGLQSSKLAEDEYKNLKDTWRIKEELDCIICTKKPDLVPEEVRVLDDKGIVLDEEVNTVTPSDSYVAQVKETGIPFPQIKRIEEVVGACLENPNKTLLFPNFSPDAGELAVLQRWGGVQKIEFHHTDNKLTARPQNKGEQ